MEIKARWQETIKSSNKTATNNALPKLGRDIGTAAATWQLQSGARLFLINISIILLSSF